MHKAFYLPGLWWFLGVPWIFLLDQWSKWWVVKHIHFGQSISLMPGLQLTLSYNRGMAFSMFNKNAMMGQILLTVMVILICIMVGVWLAKTPREDKWTGFSLMCIFGGALGNVADRLWHGHVIDFIDCYWKGMHFYTFNIADSFITLGAMMMIKTLIFPPKEEIYSNEKPL